MSRRSDLLEKAIASGDPGKFLAPYMDPKAIDFKETLSDSDKLLDDIIGSVEVYRHMCRHSNGGHATFIDKIYGTMKGRHRITEENRRKLVNAIADISVRKIRDRFNADYGALVLKSLLGSLFGLEDYFAERTVYPIETVVVKNINYRRHLHNLKTNMIDLTYQENDRARLIDNLRKTIDLDVPGVRIHLLKDLYTMNIERGYYQSSCRIMQRLAYIDDDRRRTEQMAETLLSVRKPIRKEDGTFRSDLREIRNAFAHPAGIDMGDHYSIQLSPDYSVDLYDVDLLFYTFMVEFLSQEMDMIVDVMVAVELYCRYWEEF